MWRRAVIVVFALFVAGCSRQQMPVISDVEVVQSEGESDGWPSHIVLRVEVENPSARIKILSARARVSYASRRVAMLTLEDKVVLPARSRAVVDIPLHLAVQRNSQTLAFKEALQAHRPDQIAIDWQVALRSRMAYVRYEQAPQPIEQVLKADGLEVLWSMFEQEN